MADRKLIATAIENYEGKGRSRSKCKEHGYKWYGAYDTDDSIFRDKMIRDFIAIDFETANQHPSSVCSLGVVMVRDGQMLDSFYSLIQPEPNFNIPPAGVKLFIST